MQEEAEAAEAAELKARQEAEAAAQQALEDRILEAERNGEVYVTHIYSYL